MRIIKTTDYASMSLKVASIIYAQVELCPRSVLGLATGSTPVGAYKQLIEWGRSGDADFSGISTVNLDEYCGLSGDSDQSYRYFMNHNLFDHINIDKANTHVPSGITPDHAAECERYETLIDDLGGIDLQLLGLGHNGHIGFNEPGSFFDNKTHCVDLSETTIEANTRFFASRDEVPKQAITMGMRGIMQAKKVLLAVSGDDKAEILKKALFGPITPEVPASILQLHPDLIVVTTIDLSK